jgi:hypothetical protein
LLLDVGLEVDGAAYEASVEFDALGSRRDARLRVDGVPRLERPGTPAKGDVAARLLAVTVAEEALRGLVTEEVTIESVSEAIVEVVESYDPGSNTDNPYGGDSWPPADRIRSGEGNGTDA